MQAATGTLTTMFEQSGLATMEAFGEKTGDEGYE